MEGGSGERKAEREKKNQRGGKTEQECLRFRDAKRGKGKRGRPGQGKRRRVVRDKHRQKERGGAERKARPEPEEVLPATALLPYTLPGRGWKQIQALPHLAP